VCEASAGSGKTYALAERYVRLILHLSKNNSRPPLYAILAITFTNKAAFEMKERIIRFLKQLALGVMNREEEAQMIDGLDMTPEQVRVTAHRVMAEVLRGYNYFQVQTIDRFINTLLVASAFQIGLTSAFKIKTDDTDYLELAVDELIDDARNNAAVKKAFDDLLTSLLLVEARSDWIPKDVVFDTLKGLFREYNTYARPFVRGGVTPEDILKQKIQVVDDVRVFVENMPPDIHKGVDKALRKFVEDDRRAFVFNTALSAYFAKEPEDIGRFDISGWHLDQWQKILKGFQRAAQTEVCHLYDPYIELFERVREKMRLSCSKDDVLFLAELNSKARRIYEEGVAPEELYYRLSARFEHFLFDEFQDTSLLQWENLKALPEDAIARGGSLFYVGDKKQAIFSFRGGDTILFDAVRRQYEDPGYHLFTHTLAWSRRSHRSIVAFNNAVFDMSNLTRLMSNVPAGPADFNELERVYGKAAQTVCKTEPEGCVRVEFLSGKTQEEAREDAVARTLAQIRALQPRFHWSDIGILVRKNSDVAWMTRVLLENGIPAASERTLNIKEHPHVVEAAALLRFLDQNEDNESFAAVLLGDLFSRASGILPGEIQDFILGWRERRNEPYLYKEFQRAYPSCWESLIGAYFRNAGLYPVYELLVSVVHCWGVLGGYPESCGFLMHFIELARAKENDHPSLGEFLGYFDNNEGEEFFVPAVRSDAVRVATVHKSKGLEYRVVILPFFTVGMDRAGVPGSQAPKYVLRKVEEGLALYHFNEAHTKYSTLAEEEYTREKMLAFFNELNTAYVALTRAVCEMYVFIPPKSGNSVNLALKLIPDAFLSVGNPVDVYPEDKRNDSHLMEEVAPPECRDWLRFLQDEFIKAEPEVNGEDRILGIALHEVLAKAGHIAPEGVDLFLDDALPGVIVPSGYDVRSLLKGFLLARQVLPLFSAIGEKVYTEYELVDRQGNSRRIDRLIVGGQSVTVVDFKTTRADDLKQGIVQVQNYMELLRSIYPGKAIRGVLAFIREKEVLRVRNIHG